MLKTIANVTGYRRLSYQTLVSNARQDITRNLETHDRSSYILAQYMPEPARDVFLATRGFNLEINKITNTSTVSAISNTMKFKFWSDMISTVFSNPYSDSNPGEPIAILLRDGLRNELNVDIHYFHTFLQTRKRFIEGNSFQTVDDICSYGEGTYSQLNYQIQALLLSPSISPSTINLLQYSPKLQELATDIAAHLGQAAAVGSMILGMTFYASRDQVTLPIDIMTKYDLSQETFLRLTQGHIKDTQLLGETREKLENSLFEVATTANDHILTARDKFAKLKLEISHVVSANKNDGLIQKFHTQWKRGVPDVIFIPFMTSIPTVLYLKRLEKNNFDIFTSDMQKREWRLPWNSFRNYYLRKI